VVGKLIALFSAQDHRLPIVLLAGAAVLDLLAGPLPWRCSSLRSGFMLLGSGRHPLTDAMIDASNRRPHAAAASPVSRLAIGFGVSSIVVALLGPTGEGRRLPDAADGAGGRGVSAVSP